MARAAIVLLACLVAACGGSSDDDPPASGAVKPELAATTSTEPVDAVAFCELFVNTCKSPDVGVDTCVSTYRAARVTRACAERFPTLTCEALTAEFSDLCYPPCERVAPVCNESGSITVCGETGRFYTFDCAATCASRGKTWSGTCGTTFGAQTEADAKCWCQ